MILCGFNRQASSHEQDWMSNIDSHGEEENDSKTRGCF